jgi:DNA excision repair protein ERCC-6
MSTSEEASRLRDLQADVRDQDDLERDITRQVQPSP